MRRIALLGSTGSIGQQTLDVVRRLPNHLQLVAIAAGSNAEMLIDQAIRFDTLAVAIYDETKASQIQAVLSKSVEVYGGSGSLETIACRSDVDIVVIAVAGSIGTRATIAALNAGKTVAIATKEVLVAAGSLVMEAAKIGCGTILPIDSEHSAVFQCLQGQSSGSVRKLWLTASGGPFRNFTQEQINTVTASDALNHPTWKMGRKITIDSATMMNKGLETIEASWLFSMPVDKIDVVVHPQSVVHSMVELCDGSILAQLGLPDMRLPIEYALLYPNRSDIGVERLNPLQMGTLTFESPDREKFPCLDLAKSAAEAGGTMPAVLNASNEAAVALFLDNMISFGDIPRSIDAAMQAHTVIDSPNLAQIIEADQWARGFTTARAMGVFVGV